jgi:hypothetical protein
MSGIEVEGEDHSKELMFSTGRYNETAWLATMNAGIKDLGLDLKILQEEEYPIKWTTAAGITVTGRPDMVLVNGKGEPQVGIELKAVCSLWTGVDVALKGEPKISHLMQAAHYFWQTKLPYELWYTSSVNYALGWAAKGAPAPGSPLSVYCEYNDKGGAKNLIPFRVGYVLGWDAGYLTYTRIPVEGQAPFPTVKTQINPAFIEAYYEYIAALQNTSPLPPVPENISSTGEKETWLMCGYCPLEEVCDGLKEDANVAEFMTKVKIWQLSKK